MRWLGADPTRAVSTVEELLTVKLHNRVVAEEKRQAKAHG